MASHYSLSPIFLEMLRVNIMITLNVNKEKETKIKNVKIRNF